MDQLLSSQPLEDFSPRPNTRLHGDGPGREVRERNMRAPCPNGATGDRLWLHETVCCDHAFYPDETLDSCQWREVDGKRITIPTADKRAEMLQAMYYRAYGEPHWEGAESAMPRWASRIALGVTDVRVKRLRDTSEADADAEGCERLDSESEARNSALCPQRGDTGLYTEFAASGGLLPDTDFDQCDTYSKRFHHLWSSINGPESWESNPWLWVVEFRRIQP